MWGALRRSALGFRFRRQHSVGKYVLDFYCPEKRLAVELEASVHREELRSDLDGLRHIYLASQGIRILYFRNETVLEYPERVLETIRAAVEARI